MGTNAEVRAAQLRVACPKCGAPPHQTCVTKTPHNLHAARWRAATDAGLLPIPDPHPELGNGRST